jgi:hypothetical protein
METTWRNDVIVLSQEALRHAWYIRPGKWLNTTTGFVFRIDLEAYKDYPTTKVKLTITTTGGLSGDETLSVIDAAHEAVGAPLDATVEHSFQDTIITWDVKGPGAPKGAGKENKPKKKRKPPKHKGSEFVPIFDSNERKVA